MYYKTPSPTDNDYSACEIYETKSLIETTPNLRGLPNFYEFVIEIIELINQDARFLYADFQNKYTLYDKDEVDDMKYKYVDDAINKLTYAECDKYICEIGLRNVFNLYDNSGYDDICMKLIKSIKGIRMLLFGIIMYCISVKDEVKESDEE